VFLRKFFMQEGLNPPAPPLRLGPRPSIEEHGPMNSVQKQGCAFPHTRSLQTKWGAGDPVRGGAQNRDTPCKKEKILLQIKPICTGPVLPLFCPCPLTARAGLSCAC